MAISKVKIPRVPNGGRLWLTCIVSSGTTSDLIHLTSSLHGSLLILLMRLPTFSPFLHLLHSLFVLVFFVLSWAYALQILVSTLLENLTLHCCYCVLEWNNVSPFRQLCFTGYLHSYNRLLKRGMMLCKKIIYMLSPWNKYLYNKFIIIILKEDTSLSGVHCKKLR